MSVLQDLFEIGPAARRAARRGQIRATVLKGLARVAERSFRRASLGVAGLACFTAAAFTFTVWTGLVVAGISFLVLEHRAKPEPDR